MKPSIKMHTVSAYKSQPSKLSLAGATIAILFIKKLKKSRKKTKHRANVLNEWINTEESYGRDIATAIKYIKQPMLQNSLIQNWESQVLFPEFDGILKLSELMLMYLKTGKKVSNPNFVMIGSELKSIAAGYKIYGSFFKTHAESEKILMRLTNNHENKMKEIEVKMQENVKKVEPKKQNMTIKDCMEQPLYRLFKYVLLMKQYLKKLPPTHRDYHHLNEALKTFHDINNYNNDLMKKLEEQQKKIKLQELFGKTLDQSRTYIAEMQADTIYFQGKLYILNNLIIITKIQSILGSERQERHANIEIDEFSYVAKQPDLKYFKNILILIGTYECIHLLFPDQGSRMEVYKSLHKNLAELRYKSHERRKIEEHQKKKQKKLLFTLKNNVNQVFKFEPEFRIEIVGVQVRPLSSLSNDTVYITRFMIPHYYEDQIAFLKDEGLPLPHESRNTFMKMSEKEGEQKTKKMLKRFHSLPFGLVDDEINTPGFEHGQQKIDQFLSLGQYVEIHFSQLQEIYNKIIQDCPYDIPNINPITKDVNIYSQGKKKTKFFQMRKFFIEEFFNTIIKLESVMHNPLWLLKTLRIQEDIWNYATTRNSDIKKKHQKEVDYGYSHCNICEKAKIKSIEEYEHYRNYYSNKKSHRENKGKEKYCFNFYNLMRVKLISFNYICFNTLERILLFTHNFQGRIDYPFLVHKCTDKIIKRIQIYLPSLEEDFMTVEVDSLTTVGEIIDQIARAYNIPIAFDYGLVAKYNSQNRILDRDQFLKDVILNTKIKFEEVQEGDKRETKIGFFEGIKKWGIQLISSDENKIYFFKIIHLHRSLETKSFLRYSEKKMVEVEKIFWSVKEGIIRLSEIQLIQMASLFYCLKEMDRLEHYTPKKMSLNRLSQIIPNDSHNLYMLSDKFKEGIASTIDRERALFKKNKNEKSYVYSRVIDIVSNKIEYYTYFMVVTVRQIPKQYLGSISLGPQCLIGVNYKQFVVARTGQSSKPAFTIPLNEIEFTATVFSLFMSHDENHLRFDSKLVGHFSHLMKIYQIINKQFPQHIA